MKERLPYREIKITIESKIEAIFVEINLKKRKWILIDGYNPNKYEISIFLDNIESKLNVLCLKYESIIIMGDLNSEICEERTKINPVFFQHATVIEMGLSDFHKLTVTRMKYTCYKQHTKILNYRNYNFFNNDNFRNDLLYAIKQMGPLNIGCE